MSGAHVPVMVDEVLELLDPVPGACVVDGTVGLGGHAERIAERIGPSGCLIGIDRDREALKRAARRLERFGNRVQLVHARLSFLRDAVAGSGRSHVDGVLLDLGVCSIHLDTPERGFSFRADGPLDMRLDPSAGETAAELLSRLTADQLAGVLRDGGVPNPRRLATALKHQQPIDTTRQLAAVVRSVPQRRRRHHPATLVFQALRIAVNDEFGELETGLVAALDSLRPGGRLAVLSYHSGEDRRVKRFLAEEERGCICPPEMPVCGCGRQARVRRIGRGHAPSSSEIGRNPRARSARLRGAERC